MNPFWDNRYNTQHYVYGKEPNSFFSSQLEGITPGNILLPGEGEGRNAVFAALQGWSVDAFDQSGIAKEKALALASEKGVRINYQVCLLEDFNFISNHYDGAGLIFFHADDAGRKYLHQKVYESLKPGGILIVEAFHKDQLNYNTGGPRSKEMLFDEVTLASDFEAFMTLLLERKEILLNEGSFHQGEASVIRFIGKKP
jgi:SAM-dependent methyltransferase